MNPTILQISQSGDDQGFGLHVILQSSTSHRPYFDPGLQTNAGLTTRERCEKRQLGLHITHESGVGDQGIQNIVSIGEILSSKETSASATGVSIGYGVPREIWRNSQTLDMRDA